MRNKLLAIKTDRSYNRAMDNKPTQRRTDKVVTLYLDPELKRQFYRKCFDQELTMAEVLRELVEKYVRG